MHRALAIPEVLDHILSYADKPVLAAAIRVCLAFFRASIPRLWAVIDENGAYSLIRIVTRPDRLGIRLSTSSLWDRFDMYASRVQEANLSGLRSEYVSSSAGLSARAGPLDREITLDITNWNDLDDLAYFVSIRRSTILFPRLRKLSISAGGASVPKIALVYATPMLETLHVLPERAYDYNERHRLFNLEAFLDHLHCIGVALRKLYFYTPFFGPLSGLRDIESALHPLVRQSTALQLFETDNLALGIAILPDLAQSVGCLVLGNAELIEQDIIVLPQQLSLPNLLNLRLTSSLLEATDVLRCLSAPITNLYIETEPGDDDGLALGRLMAVLPSHSLLQFRFDWLELQTMDSTLKVDHMTAVLRCSKLQHFTLECTTDRRFWPFELRDDHVIAMARAWPELRVFQVAQEWNGSWADDDSAVPDRLTIRCLESLRHNCPYLRQVSFTDLDTRIASKLASHTSTPARSPLVLQVRRSPIDDAESVYNYLKGLWSMVDVVFQWKTSDPYAEAWRLVKAKFKDGL